MPIELTDFVGVVEAATIFGVNRLTIWRWLNNGKMEYIQIAGSRFIPRGEINRLLAEEKQARLGEASPA